MLRKTIWIICLIVSLSSNIPVSSKVYSEETLRQTNTLLLSGDFIRGLQFKTSCLLNENGAISWEWLNNQSMFWELCCIVYMNFPFYHITFMFQLIFIQELVARLVIICSKFKWLLRESNSSLLSLWMNIYLLNKMCKMIEILFWKLTCIFYTNKVNLTMQVSLMITQSFNLKKWLIVL